MRTETELDERFEYPDDDPGHLIFLLLTTFAIGVIVGTAGLMLAARLGFFALV